MRFRSFCCPRRFAERNFALYLKLGWSSTELTTVSWLIVSGKRSITTAFFFSANRASILAFVCVSCNDSVQDDGSGYGTSFGFSVVRVALCFLLRSRLKVIGA